VTQAQWVANMSSNPSLFQSPSSLVSAADVPNRPVEQVSWNTIQGYLSATGFRLPTEAEWEYACRAGTQTPFYNGSTDDSTVGTLAWYGSCCGGNSGSQTHPVGGRIANGFGLYDMLGNVWECVSDWNGTYSSDAQTNPSGPTSGTVRVARGGTWSNSASNVRSSSRYQVDPSLPLKWVGFRVARNP
jgi:formylglycine-generating enzyme required for sulfatase activity